MNRDELNALLDLKPAPAKAAPAVVTATVAAPESDEAPAATVLRLDEWDHERGRKLIAGPLQYSVNADDAADLHAAAYLLAPERNPGGCTDKLRETFLTGLMDSPEYRALHQSTALNELASEMAAVQFGRQFAALRQQEEQRKARQQAKGGRPDPKGEQVRQEIAALAAAGQAVKAAQADVAELDDACQAVGLGQGSEGGRTDTAKVAETFRRVRNNSTLRRITQLAGRYRRVAQAKQRQKVRHGYDDVVGVVQDNDVGRLLPVELAKLDDPDLELDTLRRLAERQTLCRDYRGVAPKGKGPIVVCVDESGSMRGEPVCQAKAFALAMAWVAKHQNRWCCLVGYSGGREGTLCVLPPGRWDQAKLLDWLTHFYDGGTTMDVPLAELPNAYWSGLMGSGAKRGATDVCILSDAVVSVPKPMEEDFLRWKKAEGVKVHTVIIGHRSAGDLARVSDEVHFAARLGVDSEGLQSVLSI